MRPKLCFGWLLAGLVISVLVFGGSAPLCAAERVPASVLPVYPGGEVKLELSLTDQDLLPLAKAGAMLFLAMTGGQIPETFASALTPDTVADLLRDLKQVRLILYTPPEQASAAKIREFYESGQAKRGWHRAVWAQPGEGVELLAMAPDQGSGLFFLLAGRADSRMPSCLVAQTDGMINVLPLLTKLLQARPEPKAAAPPKAEE